jgi:hypothetical protein
MRSAGRHGRELQDLVSTSRFPCLVRVSVAVSAVVIPQTLSTRPGPRLIWHFDSIRQYSPQHYQTIRFIHQILKSDGIIILINVSGPIGRTHASMADLGKATGMAMADLQKAFHDVCSEFRSKCHSKIDLYCARSEARQRRLVSNYRNLPFDPRVYIEKIDSFYKVRDVARETVASLLDDGYFDQSEDSVQRALEEILHVPIHKKDWGGELNDLYTANLALDGFPVATAFLLKGNGLKRSTLEIRDCGKNGDQLVRLVDSPANLFVVQFVGNVKEAVIRDIDGKFRGLHAQGRCARYCVVYGQDTARLFRAYGLA